MIECEPDFLEQACRLAEAIRKHGHLVLFLPKFHPELNRAFVSGSPTRFMTDTDPPLPSCWSFVAIERGWSAIKTFTRKNCTFTWPGLLAMIDEAINSVTLTQVCACLLPSFPALLVIYMPLQIRNYFRACNRFASVFTTVKHNGSLAEHIVCTYRSHRGVTKNDLQLMVSKLVEKANRDKASALDQRHLSELLEILRGIADEAAEEREVERETARQAAEEAERLAGESGNRRSEAGEQQGDEEEDGECTSDLEFDEDDDAGEEDL